MIILGIETSCDETAAAVLEKKGNRITILSNVIASSANLQSKYGGIIPEQAAREQIKSIIPVIEEGLQVAGYSGQDIDAIAVTYGPGLIGSLLVGVETAKTLATIWKKPFIPVNHLLGHFYANWIAASPSAPRNDVPKFPCIGLLVSGGHTDLVLFTDHGKYQYLGGTRDDAAGECFDKCARLLGLPYPGGSEISKLAESGNPKTFDLPRPMLDSKDFDFSFSGLKTAVVNIVDRLQGTGYSKKDLAASIEAAIVDVLVEKTVRAAQKYNVEQIMVAGGVAANKNLVNRLQVTVDSMKITLHVPPPILCTDNGAMIASAGFFLPAMPSKALQAGTKPLNPTAGGTLDLQADPNLSLDY